MSAITSRGSRRRLELALLAVVVLSALAVRLLVAASSWVNPDEGTFYAAATRDTLAETLTLWRATAHPPLYHLLLRAVASLNPDPLALRGLAVLGGGVMILGVGAAGRQLGGRWTGLAAAALCAASPALVEQSSIIRPYVLQSAALAWALYFFLRGLRTADLRHEAAHGACLVVALLSHYSTLMVAGCFGLVLLVTTLQEQGARRAVERLLGAYLPFGLVALALYMVHLRGLFASDGQEVAKTTWLAAYMAGSPRDVYLRLLGLGHYLAGAGWGGPALLLAVGGLSRAARPAAAARSAASRSAASRSPTSRPGRAFVAVTVLLLAGAGLLSWRGQYPFGGTRHALYLAPFLVLAAGRGLSALFAQRLAVQVAAGVSLALAISASGWINRALGERQPPPPAVAEHLFRPAEVQAPLNAVAARPGLLLLSRQAYFTLVPAFVRDGVRSMAPPDEVFVLEWRDCTVLVGPVWELTIDGRQRNDPGHLLRVLEQVPAEVASRRPVWVFGCGWTQSLADQLAALERQAPGPRPRIELDSAFRARNVLVFRYDLDALLSGR